MAALFERTESIGSSRLNDESDAVPAMNIPVRNPFLESLVDFNGLVLEYQDLVYSQAYRLLGERHAAEDATQEAFIIAYFKFHTYRGGSLRGWILRIVTNLCFDEIRRRKRSREISLEPVNSYGEEIESPNWIADPVETPEEVTESSELQDVIQKSINKLPLDYRTVVVLVDIQGLDYAEAAGVIGCPLGTVKSRLARARLRLRTYLHDLY